MRPSLLASVAYKAGLFYDSEAHLSVVPSKVTHNIRSVTVDEEEKFLSRKNAITSKVRKIYTAYTNESKVINKENLSDSL
jgi:hypothetical protein